MPRRVAAGGSPQRASSWTIFCDLQACISEPIRIIHYAIEVVRVLFCNRGLRSERESARGSEKGTVNTADERTGEKENPAADYDDYNQQQADDDLYDSDYRSDDDLYGSYDKDYLYCSDTDIHDSEYYEDEEACRHTPPPSLRITYNGDNPNIQLAYCFSRYLVELLCVRPHFPFLGTFACFNDCSAYYYIPQGQHYSNVDSQGNLIISAQGGAIEDAFQIKVEIPEDNNIEVANFGFRVNPYTCNRVITRTIPTSRGRRIDVTFVPLHTAIQANVLVNLDLIAGGSSSTVGGAIYYVYGEITACHQLYDQNDLMLFFRKQDNKAKVIHGKLPLLRSWAAVPVYLDPLLIIKLSLHVSTNRDCAGSISFQGDLTFDRDQYKKSICNAHHGEVKVQISYG